MKDHNEGATPISSNFHTKQNSLACEATFQGGSRPSGVIVITTSLQIDIGNCHQGDLAEAMPPTWMFYKIRPRDQV